MASRWAKASSPLVVIAVGASLFLASFAHHVTEIRLLDSVSGPTLAFTLDALLALGIVYAGYRLAGSELAPRDKWVVAVGCLLGAAVFAGTTGASIAIRRFEGRAVSEPTFQLLLSAGVGGLAGLVGGYFNARFRESARQAEKSRTNLAVVNDVLRHDVRNNMSAILAHADLAASAGDDADVADSVTVIREQAEQATSLIESTRTIVETLSNGSDFGRVDLAAIAEEVADKVDDAYAATVTTELPDSAPVAANEGVRSAVSNLVENAAEHNDADDPEVAVRVDEGEETVRIRVVDNGPGLSDRRKAEVFEPREEDHHGGGLFLAATLVKNYGGDVRVEDNDAGGATFVLELPRHDTE